MTLSPGVVLNQRYQINAVLAKGGMGAIYQAFDLTLNVAVAVKENLLSSEDFTRQFRREATILAGLRHSNLPRVTDHFLIEGQGQYLIMDFIEGDDLRQQIEKLGKLPVQSVVNIGLSICEALYYLHNRTQPIIHRDIKPGNIKITPTGQVFLVDFGIAKITQAGQATTSGAQSLTPGFSPPEQYVQGTDPRSDIYSLGATLYHALTGFIPANGLVRMTGSGDLIPILQHRPETPPQLAYAIEKALTIKREDRYQRVEDFKADLLKCLPEAVQPISTPKKSQTQQPIPQTQAKTPPPAESGIQKKKPMLFVLGGIGILALCGLVFGGIWAYRNFIAPSPSQTPSTVTDLLETSTPSEKTLTPSPEVTTDITETVSITEAVLESSPTTEFTPTISLTPQGGSTGEIAFASDRNGTPQIYIINADGSNLRQVTNEISGACQPSWSPDGLKLVFTSPCKLEKDPNPISEIYPAASLFIVNVDGTSRRPLSSIPGGDFDPSWSPDGQNIVFSTLRDNLSTTDVNIYLYDLTTNKATPVTKDLSYDRHARWSPDGKHLVLQRIQLERQVWIINPDGSQAEHFSDINKDYAYMPDWSSGGLIVFAQGEKSPGLFIKQADASNNAPEVKVTDGPAWNPDFSPDGTLIVYEGTDAAKNYELFIIPWNGGVPINITNDPARDYQPVWHP